MEITQRQRWFAENLPWRVWCRTFEALGAAGGLAVGGAWAFSSGWSWTGIGYGVLCGLAGLFLGTMLSFLCGWFVLGPLYHHQACLNGFPYAIGDEVQILAGKHRGRRGRVYELGQFGRPRVRLGEEAARDFGDLFEPTEVARVAGGDARAAGGQ